ncbi:MAG TPA: FkbM family methyltransferase [Burkholderiaceae bacterium]|nr:FkbM family methyltransferase [Burkholderiaceae bacterium]
MFAALQRTLGIARSFALYYGVPLRARRMRRLYRQFVSPGDLCFDIGAHVGNRVACWRALGARVVAVEPQPDFVRILNRLFGSDPNVTVLACALGAAPGRERLQLSLRTPTVTTLSPQWIERVQTAESFAGVEWTLGPSVEIAMLDSLIAAHGEPAFTKVDVEGMELAVLEGLSRPLRALSFEYLPVTREIAIACVQRLGALAEYRYNWSVGESQRLASDRWLGAGEMRQVLAGLSADAGSGDVYAVRATG